jgi:mRNA interferase RelE/StbE
MIYDIKFYPRAEKDLNKILVKDKTRIFKSLLSLKENSLAGKKLKGSFSGYYSLRVWPYRIIYCIRNKECLIIIIRISQRKDVYR